MNYNKIEYDKKFDENHFELNSIINTNKKEEDNNKITNETKENITNNEDTRNNTDTTTNNNTNTNNEETSNNTSTTTESPNNNELSTNNNTKETLSIQDVIYPMYLPENTYLTSQERIDTEKGERLILTFSGDNPFVLVEETISETDSNLVIPVSGEFDFLSDVIGVIGTNSVMWHSNGIEYYITSNTMETAVLVEIARSISVLPVSK